MEERDKQMMLRINAILIGLCATMALALQASAQTVTTLYSFCSDYTCTDGSAPFSGLVQGTDGNLYGTAQNGGEGNFGTVFKITPTGTLTTLHWFSGTDGGYPGSALIQASDGYFYGVTTYGGTYGFGTVFKIAPGGALTTLANFDGADGSQPSGIIQGTDGNFYGTTAGGGFFTCDQFGISGCGTVFQMTPSGALTTLYQFCSQLNCRDGFNPHAGLVQATDGNFYGTTALGGDRSACPDTGCGTVFEINPSGTLTTLHRFDTETQPNSGAVPFAELIQARNGNLYGATTGEYGDDYYSSIFRITPSGILTTMYTFCLTLNSNCSAGTFAWAGVIQATDSNFYGTLIGYQEWGVPSAIYQITPTGALTPLCNLDGYQPYGGLIQATDGNFYGTASSDEFGTVYKLSMGLAPFVETQPNSGPVGATVNILGMDLTGVTSVTFHGTEAKFKVVSPSYLRATVPSGATSGFVKVMTSTGPLISNVVFAVTP
jgi:uncharacterized repeat protein (TIGR03803 family)